MSYNWTTPIRYVRGLGPTRSKELTKIGINTIGDLLEYQPLHYIYPGGVSIAEAKEGHVVIKAKIKGIKRWDNWGSTVGGMLDDGTGTCGVIWYNSPWTLQNLRPGMTVTFWGKYKGGVLQQPKWTTVESSLADVYGGQYGVHHATIRAALQEVLAHTDLQQPNKVELPDMMCGQSRAHIFRLFHFPNSKRELEEALWRLKFDELLCQQLALAERRKKRKNRVPFLWQFNFTQHKKIMGYFPYEFTNNQKNVVKQITHDITARQPMQRLIHGEVGSGKTAVAFYAAMLAALNGKRTLILTPTTILAQQHYDTLKGMRWDDVGLYRTGETFQPNTHIVIGTHNLLNLDWLVNDASLVIIDEFQKFGVEQRAKVQRYNPHLLLLSATPIPRTLAATAFGDLDVSTIRQLPIERGTVVTRWVLPEKREAMYEIIERELAKGKQAYVVYPRISGGEDVVSAEKGFKRLRERYHKPGYSYADKDHYHVNILTGRDSTEDKAHFLQCFREGRTKILVSTIIAEVGLDNPNATVMVVEGADRFGLSQLHQLRGRVCRSEETAYCFLVSDTANEKSIARLDVIEKCNCGFEIAEHDLRLRGAGELFSTKQHGLPNLKFASLVDDFDLMQEVRELVQSGSVGEGSKEMMRIKYAGLLVFGDVV